MSIQFDLPMSVIALNTLRAPGCSAFARSTMKGSISREPTSTKESAISTWSKLEKSFRRNVMRARLGSVSARRNAR